MRLVGFAEAVAQLPFLQKDDDVHRGDPQGEDKVGGEIIRDERVAEEGQ